jgi:hypothetical protein
LYLRLEVQRGATIINVISRASLPLTTHQDGHVVRGSPKAPRLGGHAAHKGSWRTWLMSLSRYVEAEQMHQQTLELRPLFLHKEV